MRHFLVLLVLSVGCLGQTNSATKPVPQYGRYQIIFKENVRADTWLLDTDTGKVWRMTTITDAPGQPHIWLAEERIDTEQQFIEWANRHPNTPAVPQDAAAKQ